MRRLRWKQRRAAATRSCGNSRRRTRADEGKRGEAPYHPGMEKRVVFRSAWLPYALLVPQIAVTIVFFFWPAVQAFWFSFQLQDAFGIRTEFAGLQSIPRSLVEAAAIDGAGPARLFWTIVFPLLSPTTFFLLVVNIVYAFFDTFGVIDSTTQGGPAGATQILVYKVYYDGVKAGDLGGSSAQSVILMLIVIALTVAQFRFIERKVQY